MSMVLRSKEARSVTLRPYLYQFKEIRKKEDQQRKEGHGPESFAESRNRLPQRETSASRTKKNGKSDWLKEQHQG